jgi:hypothetical protein
MMENKKKIVLTRDLVPIHIRQSDQHSAMFTCPLPANYLELLKKVSPKELSKAVENIIEDVNSKAERMEEPFQNILLGYEGRSDWKELLSRNFKIRFWHFDNRGLYVVSIHGAEGDIYISTEAGMKCDSCVYDIADEYFDKDYAFYCHNMDYYWQALMVREVLIRYFNFLVSL